MSKKITTKIVYTKIASAVLVAFGMTSAPSIAGPGSVTDSTGTYATYYANSPLLRKFVDTLPGLTSSGKNTFAKAGAAGQYIPVASPDLTSYAGSEYFILAVVEYSQLMHSDLQKATTLRGYVQLYPKTSERAKGFTLPNTAIALKYPNGSSITWPNTSPAEQVYAYDNPHYLGPMITTNKGTPVRLKVMNFLPVGKATLDINGKVTKRNGDIFLPVDQSLLGAGNIQNTYPQNRISIHLHGGDSPWISDGTPHEWISPANDPTPYKKGDRLTNVPDMPDPGDGGMTLFWPNNQSARLMWFHDHTFGTTRQNAYGGEAAPYLINDPAESNLLGSTIPADMIPLIIQDKTFVPNDIAIQDAKWDTKAWGLPGDLWFPHVYEPNIVLSGTALVNNPAGRWDFGPTDPLAPTIAALPLADGSYGNASTTPESYMDTPVINGVAYPTLTVQPKAYRVRFLNAANDRYFNLSLWVADSNVPALTDGRINTEVKMIEESPNTNCAPTSFRYANGRPGGIPDPSTAGPNIIQFGNEGGLLPSPVIHTPKPMNFDCDLSEINGGFYLANAERADTVIDFSQYAGKTLILYNDSAAPVPDGDTRYDYYTGNADQSTMGGAPSTTVGFGPNTRTIMQIKVAAKVTGAASAPSPANAYETTTLPTLRTTLLNTYTNVADTHIDNTIIADGAITTSTVADLQFTYPTMKIKTIEGGYETNMGRLTANFGLELANVPGVTPVGYIDKPSEIINQGETQYWLIKNDDADNHPIHFHLFNVQVLARVNHLTGLVSHPQPNEAGWKDTVQNWPGQDVLVAMKPKTPELPFGLPDSYRLMAPTLAAGATTNTSLDYTNLIGPNVPLAFLQYDLTNGAALPATQANEYYDYGWEYTWHCHILGHEENDLMRPMVYFPTITQPGKPSAVMVSNGLVTWVDPTPANNAQTKGNSSNEIGFRVERADAGSSTFSPLATSTKFINQSVNTLANATSFQDTSFDPTKAYSYRVIAVNQAIEGGSTGETASDSVQVGMQAPAALNATFNAIAPNPYNSISLNWTDTSGGETGYEVSRSTATINKITGVISWSAFSKLPLSNSVLAANLNTYLNTPVPTGALYQFQVNPVNGLTKGPTSTSLPITTSTVLPTLVQLQANGVNTKTAINFQWQVSTSGLVTHYEVQRCNGIASPSSNWTTLTKLNIGVNSTKYLDSGLTSKTTYSYRVRAVNSLIPSLVSPWSAAYTAITL